jgi:formylglycine-generating enzyme
MAKRRTKKTHSNRGWMLGIACLVVAAVVALVFTRSQGSRDPASKYGSFRMTNDHDLHNLMWQNVRETITPYYQFKQHPKKNYSVGTLIDGSKKISYWRAFEPGYSIQQDDSRNRVLQDDREKRPRETYQGRGCGEGMVRVSGKMVSWEIAMKLQDQACMDKDWKPTTRCMKFDREKLNYKAYYNGLSESEKQRLAPKQLDYCIDRYEFPNVPGEFPAIMVSWVDAKSLCANRGKELCSEDQWTFACEGEEGLPYPYGYERDPDACNIDRELAAGVNPETVMKSTDPKVIGATLSKLWGGFPSGSMPGCSSPFGVYDMTGNIDEWSEWTEGGRPRDKGGAGNRKPINGGEGFPSMLKGGFWTKARTRCQPSTSSHGPDFYFYQQGFRCCSPVAAGQR